MAEPLSSKEPNEHGYLLTYALTRSGIPVALFNSEFQVDVFVRSQNGVPGTALKSVAPAPFSGSMSDANPLNRPADSTAPRRYFVPGLAGLPDHSLSVWDWTNGNERCAPATGAAANAIIDCHKLSYHLGALNSTHFSPQSQATYAWYHAVAMDRAKQCKELYDALKNGEIAQAAPEYTAEFVRECKRQAVSIEVFGQHFLQDAWSMGHMWQRWGAANLDEFPSVARRALGNGQFQDIPIDRLTLARIVAATAGMIHGAEAMDRELLASDRLGGGAEYVELPSGSVAPGVGDYRAEVLANPQLRRFISCSVAGLREVYGETSQATEPMGAISGGIDVIQPAQLLGDDCFGQRATNASIRDGMALDLTLPGGTKKSLTFQDIYQLATSAGDLVQTYFPVLYVATELMTDQLIDAYMLELNRIFMLADTDAKLDPDGTNVANDFGGFLGVKENSHYSATPPARLADARFADPSQSPLRGLPAQGSARLDEESTTARLTARFFNRAHVADWCTDPESSQDALLARVQQASASGVPVIERQGACAVCMEFLARHVQLKTAGGGYADSVCQLARAPGEPVPAGYPESDDTVGLANVVERLQITARRTCGCDSADVMVSTAADFSGFDTKVAINNQGMVAFSGTLTATGEVSGFVSAQPGAYKLVTFQGLGSRQFAGASIMNASEPSTAFRERVAGAPATFFIRRWSYSAAPTLIGRSPNAFDSAAFFLDVNDAGLVAFQALVDGSVNTALMAGFNDLSTIRLATFSGSAAIRPQISGANDIVYRRPDGTVSVIKYIAANVVNPQFTIAGPPAYASVGDRPGISNDGQFVGFVGTAGGLAGVRLVNRDPQMPGTWTVADASANAPGGTGQFVSFPVDKRVGVANMAGTDGGRRLRVLFAARRQPPNQNEPQRDGIYVVDSNLSAAGDFSAGTARKLIEVGDVINVAGGSEVVTGFDLWDPLSSDGKVAAFWVSLQSGKQAILRQTL